MWPNLQIAAGRAANQIIVNIKSMDMNTMDMNIIAIIRTEMKKEYKKMIVKGVGHDGSYKGCSHA